jgi:hypothetical protein
VSHQTSGTILHSMLEPFDPDSTHYSGIREHFGTQKLLRIDQLRAKPDDYQFTFNDRLFICWMLSKVVMTAQNPDSPSESLED